MKRRILAGIMAFCMVLCLVPNVPAGAKTKAKADFLYTVNGKSVTLTKYQGKSKKVVIPEKIAGKTVENIGVDCFAKNKKVTSIKLTSDDINVDEGAMITAKNISTIELGPKVEDIDIDLFLRCKSLKKITVDKKNKEFASYNGALYNKELDTLKYVPAKCKKKFISKNISKFDEYSCSDLNVTQLTIPAATTSIDNMAFQGNTGIKQIIVPKQMNYFNPKIVKDCASLTAVSIEEGNGKYTSVDGCVYNKVIGTLIAVPRAKTGALTVPATVNLVDEYAAFGCSLDSVVLPASVTTVGQYAFYDATVGQITMSENLIALGGNAFAKSRINAVDLSKTKLAEISDACFSNSLITKITLPATVKKISNRGFYQCPLLTDVVFPEGMEELGMDAFSGCKSLSTITIPASLTKIKVASGANDTLDKVKLNDSYMDVYDEWYYDLDEEDDEDYYEDYYEDYDYYDEYISNTNPFVGCHNLKTIEVNKDNPIYCSENGVWYNKDKTVLYCVPALYEGTYTVPGSLNTIYNSAFAYVKNISSIVVPDTVQYIGAGAFANSSLTSVYLSSKIQYIRNYTFSNSKVTDVVVPDQVKYIGLGAFCNCSELNSVSLPASLTSIEDDFDDDALVYSAFTGSPKLSMISVDGQNEYYKSIGGVLYTTEDADNSKELVFYPPAKKGKSYKLPKGYSIGVGAFDNCKYLKKVTIPEGIKTLEQGFVNCKNITLIAPKSLKKFGYVELDNKNYGIMVNCKKFTVKAPKNSKIINFCKKNKIKNKGL